MATRQGQLVLVEGHAASQTVHADDQSACRWQRWRWPLATSPNAKIFAMWRKICDVFSHSGEDKNEMLPQYLWILSRFCGKNDCITIVFLHKHGFILFFKFSIDLASIFQFCRSKNIAIITYIIDYMQHKKCLFTFSTKKQNGGRPRHRPIPWFLPFLWSVHLIIWCCLYTLIMWCL